MRKVMWAVAAIALSTTAAWAQHSPGTFHLSDAGRFHGYVSWPVYCGIAKCGDNWRVPGQSTQSQVNGRVRRANAKR